ncbi:MAG TPA: transcription-repair coupling factor [Nitrospiria bacterium]|jgi:transcription-repair coupling factor (superfamily II helicase)|nr:transcription-repair coupling factor [Nitrospiria bacterium]
MVFSGLWGSAKSAVVAGILHETNLPLFVLTATDAQAESFHQDLVCWYQWLGRPADEPILFPSPEILPYELTAPHPDLVRERMRALYGMAKADPGRAGRPVLLVASVAAAMQRVRTPVSLREAVLSLSAGQSADRDGLIESLVDLGYTRTDRVEHPGEFSVRGGILDLFSTADREPVRIEWAGDQVESIRFFDPETQRSAAAQGFVGILPAREPTDEANATVMDYLPTGTHRVLDEPGQIQDLMEEFDSEVRLARSSLPADRRTALQRYLTSEELNRHLQSGPSILLETSHFETDSERDRLAFSTRSPESLGLGVRGTPFSSALKTADDLRRKARVIFVGKTPVQSERLTALFREHDLPAETLPGPTFPPPPGPDSILPFTVAVGAISSGFIDLQNRLALLTDEDLFGKTAKHRPAPKLKRAQFLASLEDMEEGDYLVHAQHGIARYEGLKRLSIQGYESDFMILRYRGGDTLYLPVDRLNLVQKYTGVEGHRPKLDRLGGVTWARTTRRVKKAVETIAKEIVELYAVRETTPGHSFSKNAALGREFDAAFAYEETPDQLRAIEEIHKDMEESRPMDRLICGDVGYGKTEVAMRAAFMAVIDGKQVAVLVPTTLLAQQHGETFRERFAPFPVRVETLSRFRTPKEQKAVLSDLAAGRVDIAIGTHRLLQKDVVFHDLGLLIVDEEQRFGVGHKEKLKQLRKTVDTLTLSATPIPRTLQMALTGIRELSIIDTPPADRLAVRTILTRFDRSVIRNAILRELARGGQVFFVHNRVQDIERLGQFLRELVPEARLAVAHGQMHGRELEQVMWKFVHQETNVLLTTTIIESGLDIPTANTILINDAHRFGLSDLYQLRGRVGRSGHQAFAYLLVPSDRGLTEEARARIQAIQEFCELGAGFRIAARDLEIRGAGNFLGKQQSGHIAAVGFDFYLQLIEECVKDLKGEPAEAENEPTLNLKVSAYIPETYMPDTYQRLAVYRRLSDLKTEADLAAFRAELEDRYGAPPDPVERLLQAVQIKALARKLKILSLDSRSDGIHIAFDPAHPLTEAQVRRHLSDASGRLRVVSEFSVRLRLGESEQAEWPTLFSTLRNYLQSLL